MNDPNNRLHYSPGAFEQQMAIANAQQAQVIQMHISIAAGIVAQSFDKTIGISPDSKFMKEQEKQMERLADAAVRQSGILLRKYGIEVKLKEQD